MLCPRKEPEAYLRNRDLALQLLLLLLPYLAWMGERWVIPWVRSPTSQTCLPDSGLKPHPVGGMSKPKSHLAGGRRVDDDDSRVTRGVLDRVFAGGRSNSSSQSDKGVPASSVLIHCRPKVGEGVMGDKLSSCSGAGEVVGVVSGGGKINRLMLEERRAGDKLPVDSSLLLCPLPVTVLPPQSKLLWLIRGIALVYRNHRLTEGGGYSWYHGDGSGSRGGGRIAEGGPVCHYGV